MTNCDVCASKIPHTHRFTADVQGRRAEILSFFREAGEYASGGRYTVRFQDTGRIESAERWQVIPGYYPN